jgi:cytochrome c oxidase assembly factor CtaG
MSTWESISWAPICFGLTIAGLIVSWLAWRRRGVLAGSRGVAWSLLPLAAYLTGAILLVGRIGSAIVRFAGSFVFSPRSWAGVVLFGLAAVLFLGTGGLPLLRWRRRRASGRAQPRAAQAGGQRAAAVSTGLSGPVTDSAKRTSAGEDDDFAEVAEILKRRGIS